MHAPALHRRRFMQCNVLFLSLSHRRKARPGRPSGGQQRRRLLPCAALVAPRHGLVDWTSLVNHHTPQLPRPPAIGCPSCHRPVVRPARCVAPAIGQRFRLRTCLQLSGSLQKSQGKHQHWLHGERSESEMLSMLVRCTSAQSTFLPLCTCIASHHAVSSSVGGGTGYLTLYFGMNGCETLSGSTVGVLGPPRAGCTLSLGSRHVANEMFL
jgi:hypothetical protein